MGKSSSRRVVAAVFLSLPLMGGSIHAGGAGGPHAIHDVKPRSARPGDLVTLAVTGAPDAIFPLGGRAGSSIEVRFDGGSLESPRIGRAGPRAAIGPRLVGVPLPRGLSGRAGWPFLCRIGTLPESLEGARGESTPCPSSR